MKIIITGGLGFVGSHLAEKLLKKKGTILDILRKNNFFINKVLKDYGKNDRCIISTKI